MANTTAGLVGQELPELGDIGVLERIINPRRVGPRLAAVRDFGVQFLHSGLAPLEALEELGERDRIPRTGTLQQTQVRSPHASDSPLSAALACSARTCP